MKNTAQRYIKMFYNIIVEQENNQALTKFNHIRQREDAGAPLVHEQIEDAETRVFDS